MSNIFTKGFRTLYNLLNTIVTEQWRIIPFDWILKEKEVHVFEYESQYIR